MSNVPTPVNLNSTVPAAPSGAVNVVFQADNNIPRNITAYVASGTYGSPAQIQQEAFIYAPDSGAANAYVVTLNPAPSTLVAGSAVAFKAANANTGASTLNPNGLGAVTLKKWQSGSLVDLAAGDISAGQILYVKYDGTVFQVLGGLPIVSSGAGASQSGVQAEAYTYAADTGSANAYAVTLSPAPGSYTAGLATQFKAAHSNTGASTLNINSLGATALKKWSGGALVDLASGDITAGQIIYAKYDGSVFQVLGGLSASSGSNAVFPFGGDGSDGSVTFDGSSTVLGLVPSSSTYTLTRDIWCINLTLNAGVTIKTANYRIFATGTVTINGTVTNDGQAGNPGTSATSATGAGGGSGGTSSSGLSNGSLPQELEQTPLSGTAGGSGQISSGSNGTAGGAGAGLSFAALSGGSAGSTGSQGGSGGNGTNGTTGGSGGTPAAGGSAPSVAVKQMREPVNCIDFQFMTPGTGASTSVTLAQYRAYSATNGSSTGGGGGGGDGSTNSGGGGGGGGGQGGDAGIVLICATTVSIGASGIVSAQGGKGGNGGNGFSPTAGNVGGGGGGAGGPGGLGGYVIILYQALTNSGTIQFAGGSGGNPGTHGSGHGTGSNGNDGATGGSGKTGAQMLLQC